MAVTVKDTKKIDVKIKGATISEGKFYDEGEEKNINDLLSKAFGEGVIFDISATVKTDEEVDIEATE